MDSVYIIGVETVVPENAYSQEYAKEKMLSWVSGEKERRLIRQIYSHSGIDNRYSVLNDFFSDDRGGLFGTCEDGRPAEPGTGERNDLFVSESRKLAVEAARRAIQSSGFSPGDITHVVTASCTGFANPGADYFIVRDLGLRHQVSRFNLGFMGCYASIPAVHMARDFCITDPSAVVLVVSIELCTLHLRFAGGFDSLLANAIFADGSAAAVVSRKRPDAGRPALRVEGFASTIIPEGMKDMAWKIGNKGFEIGLSTYVPDLIGRNIKAILEPVLAEYAISLTDVGIWAVHPGGKAILDKVQKELGFDPVRMNASREILRRYGNMSSATILFVLKEIMEGRSGVEDKNSRVCAMAFGPGLTVESAMMVMS